MPISRNTPLKTGRSGLSDFIPLNPLFKPPYARARENDCSSEAIKLVPGLREAASRLKRLADLERQAKDEGLWDVTVQAQRKTEAVMVELEASLASYFGGRSLCPLCEPELLEVYPPPNSRLRQCVKHSLRLLLLLGPSEPSSSDGGKPFGRSSKPTRTLMDQPTSRVATSYEFWKLALEDSPRTTPNEKLTRSRATNDGSQYRRP